MLRAATRWCLPEPQWVHPCQRLMSRASHFCSSWSLSHPVLRYLLPISYQGIALHKGLQF